MLRCMDLCILCWHHHLLEKRVTHLQTDFVRLLAGLVLGLLLP